MQPFCAEETRVVARRADRSCCGPLQFEEQEPLITHATRAAAIPIQTLFTIGPSSRNCNKLRVCQKTRSGDAALVYNVAPVEAQTARSTYNLLSEPKGGHARKRVGGRIGRLRGDGAAHPSYRLGLSAFDPVGLLALQLERSICNAIFLPS
jgi:hypothetical protein